MYLLNLVATHFYQVATKFTFHYVSIKSAEADKPTANNKWIYIPLCIY